MGVCLTCGRQWRVERHPLSHGVRGRAELLGPLLAASACDCATRNAVAPWTQADWEEVQRETEQALVPPARLFDSSYAPQRLPQLAAFLHIVG